MYRYLLCILLISACAGPESDNTTSAAAIIEPSIIETGRLQNPAIDESSGLAASRRQPGRQWTMNDRGSPPVLYALAADGTEHGSVRLTNARNVDWEDLASFELNGKAWLLVADIGDNVAKREQVNLYIVEEPDLSTPDAQAAWQIVFDYPDGPQDSESVAVDARERLIYVLSKRTIPARLYSVPLMPEDDAVTATYLGDIVSLPQPTPDEQSRALAEENWFWQPTAMDFSDDGRTAIILTYRAIYVYRRAAGETWFEALQKEPVALELGDIGQTEAASLNADHIFLSVEARRGRLYRVPFRN